MEIGGKYGLWNHLDLSLNSAPTSTNLVMLDNSLHVFASTSHL